MDMDGGIRYGYSVDADDMKNSLKVSRNEAMIRKIICRYGSGCTHILDPTHKEKFWHPSPPALNDEQLKSQFICNECGYATSSLPDLQLHLKRKTAWSNTSLIGCRINCLVDYKEWHEGFVTQYHKSGKHFVEFRMVNEKRWLLMKKIAFYIVERPPNIVHDSSEFKENVPEPDGLAPIEDCWIFSEDISIDYAFAQSVLFKIYGNNIQETGHLTKGHVCLTDTDRINAQYCKGSLLYGELLPRGANKAFGGKRLDAMNSSVLFDLGMGTGKILIQAFLQFKNLRYIYGVELSVGRYKIAEKAVLKLVRLLGTEHYQVQIDPGNFIIITEAVPVEKKPNLSKNPSKSQFNSSEPGFKEGEEVGYEFEERVLHLQCGNMFDANVEVADVVMMETDIPTDLYVDLQRMLGSMKEGARVLTYLDLRRVWETSPLPFKQLEANRHLSDRYPTSWSVQRGHHFYLWQKLHALEIESHSSGWGNSVHLGLGLGFSGLVSSNGHASPIPFSQSCQYTNGVNSFLNTSSSNLGNTTNSPNTRFIKNHGTTGFVGEGLEGAVLRADNSIGHENEDNSDGRCVPFRLRRFLFGDGSGKKRKGRKNRSTQNMDHEINNDRSIIPINSDGSRSLKQPGGLNLNSSALTQRPKDPSAAIPSPESSDGENGPVKNQNPPINSSSQKNTQGLNEFPFSQVPAILNTKNQRAKSGLELEEENENLKKTNENSISVETWKTATAVDSPVCNVQPLEDSFVERRYHQSFLPQGIDRTKVASTESSTAPSKQPYPSSTVEKNPGSERSRKQKTSDADTDLMETQTQTDEVLRIGGVEDGVSEELIYTSDVRNRIRSSPTADLGPPSPGLFWTGSSTHGTVKTSPRKTSPPCPIVFGSSIVTSQQTDFFVSDPRVSSSGMAVSRSERAKATPSQAEAKPADHHKTPTKLAHAAGDSTSSLRKVSDPAAVTPTGALTGTSRSSRETQINVINSQTKNGNSNGRTGKNVVSSGDNRGGNGFQQSPTQQRGLTQQPVSSLVESNGLHERRSEASGESTCTIS